jgi:phospholipid/cholesterol/gamma-HCH transport system substrate-binding protein
MDLHYKQEVTVGALVIVAVALFLAGTMWLGGVSFRKHKLWHVQFDNVGKLVKGSLVKVSGVEVGRVQVVELEPNGKVLVGFSLSPQVVLKADASATIEESLAFSDATLVLNPGSAPTPLEPNQVLIGRRQAGPFDKVQKLGDRADSVMLGLQSIANERTANDLHATLLAMQKMLRVTSEKLPQTSAEAQRTMVSLQHLSARLDSTLANPALTRTLDHLDSATSNLSAMSAQFTTTGARLDTLLAGIAHGKGTMGRFATDSGLYYGALGASNSLKALLDTLQKHPGKITVQVKIF